jgi:hypothetical protein
MLDSLLGGSMRATVLGMITATAGAGLFFGYRALFDLFATRWNEAGLSLILAAALAGAAYLVARHRTDLIDSV